MVWVLIQELILEQAKLGGQDNESSTFICKKFKRIAAQALHQMVILLPLQPGTAAFNNAYDQIIDRSRCELRGLNLLTKQKCMLVRVIIISEVF